MNTDSNEKDPAFRPTRKLGQNFLIDKTVVSRIIDSADLDDSDVVIEVGPGKGALTGSLLSLAKKVYAIEKDNFLYKELLDNYSDSKNLMLINQYQRIHAKKVKHSEKYNPNC